MGRLVFKIGKSLDRILEKGAQNSSAGKCIVVVSSKHKGFDFLVGSGSRLLVLADSVLRPFDGAEMFVGVR